MATLTENGRNLLNKSYQDYITLQISYVSFPIWYKKHIVGSYFFTGYSDNSLQGEAFISDPQITEGLKSGKLWLDKYVLDKFRIRDYET